MSVKGGIMNPMNIELRIHRKSRYLVHALALLLGALFVVSCATTPKPAATTTAAQPAQTTQNTALNAELQKAKSMKQEIDQYQLGSLVPDAYRQGSNALTSGEQVIGSDNATAKSKLDEAVADFQKVLDSGLPLALKQEEQATAKAKSDADAVKAAEAAPDQYKQAEAYEQQAKAKQQAGSLTDAYALWKEAAAAYDKAAEVAKQKRADAQAALQQADQAIGQAKSQVEEIQKNLESSTSQNGTGGQ